MQSCWHTAYVEFIFFFSAYPFPLKIHTSPGIHLPPSLLTTSSSFLRSNSPPNLLCAVVPGAFSQKGLSCHWGSSASISYSLCSTDLCRMPTMYWALISGPGISSEQNRCGKGWLVVERNKLANKWKKTIFGQMTISALTGNRKGSNWNRDVREGVRHGKS